MRFEFKKLFASVFMWIIFGIVLAYLGIYIVIPANGGKAYPNSQHLNALMTLEEYLMDYASPETKAIGDKLIDREILNVPNEKARAVVRENLRLIR